MAENVSYPTRQNKVQIGELRIGFFFDGTRNNKSNLSLESSNINRLWELYDDSSVHIKKFYVRGVGSKRIKDKDLELGTDGSVGTGWYGAGFGRGGKIRTELMLEKMIDAVLQYKLKHPLKKVVLDVFGFSRGAALARHFVNQIHRKTYEADTRFNKEIIQVQFLGIFDTVGSFFMPGNNKDGGYNFHIDKTKAKHVYHLISEDELRANFDLQSLKSNIDDPLLKESENKDVESPFIVEEMWPGVHSDLGGGYYPLGHERVSRYYCYNDNEMNKKEVSRLLSIVFLKKMYDKAHAYQVPLKDIDFSLKYGKNFGVLLQQIDEIKEFYMQYPLLQPLNALLQATLRSIEGSFLIRRYETGVKYEPSRGGRLGDISKINDYKNPKKPVDQVSLIEKNILTMMPHNEWNNFKSLYKSIRANHIHISHAPISDSLIGMEPEFRVGALDEWPLNKCKQAINPKDFSAIKSELRGIRRCFFNEENSKQAHIDARTYFRAHLKISIDDSRGKVVPIDAGYKVSILDCDQPLLEDGTTLSERRVHYQVLGSGCVGEDGIVDIFAYKTPELKRTKYYNIVFKIEISELNKQKVCNRVRVHNWLSANSPGCLSDTRYSYVLQHRKEQGIIRNFQGSNIGTEQEPLEIAIKQSELTAFWVDFLES